MRVTFHRDLYNPAVYGQAFDGDVKEIPDDVARQLIAKGTVSEYRESWSVAKPGLVSCIMPTANRREWIPRAIACFQAQTYKNIELVILDTGESIQDLLPADDRIKYIRMSGKFTTGQLRNLCCQVAHGEFIAHWDDDDWSHPARIEEQLAALGDKQVTAYNSMVFHGPKEEYYLYMADQWNAIGTSLLFRKAFWTKNRFPHQAIGEDMIFAQRARGQMTYTDGTARMVASIHAANTSPRPVRSKEWKKVTADRLPEGYR